MTNSKKLAGLIGPAIIAVTTSETVNVHIWENNTAAGIYLNGSLLFLAGLAIIRSHNEWVLEWPVLITITGWFLMVLGLFRMFAPELQLEGARNTTLVIPLTMVVLALGIFLTFKAFFPKN